MKPLWHANTVMYYIRDKQGRYLQMNGQFGYCDKVRPRTYKSLKGCRRAIDRFSMELKTRCVRRGAWIAKYECGIFAVSPMHLEV